MAKRQRDLVSGKKPLIFILILMAVLLAAVIWCFNPFIVKEVIVAPETLSCITSDSLLDEFQIYSQNIFLFSENKTAAEIAGRYPCVSRAKIVKTLPDKVEITLESRKPKFAVYSYLPPDEGIDLASIESTREPLINTVFPAVLPDQKYMGVDNEGVVLDLTGNENLFQVYLPVKDLEPGRKLDNLYIENIVFVTEKIAGISSEYGLVFRDEGVPKGKVFDSSILLNTKPYIIFNLGSDTAKQVASLQLILREAKMDIEDIELVDLRFDKPVVEYLKS